MADVVLTKQRIEPGKTDRLREWCAEIREREDEALATLEDEGMHAEAAFVESHGGDEYLIYYMKADDIDAVYEAFSESEHAIDEEHRTVMRDVLVSGEDVGNYELLYQLSTER